MLIKITLLDYVVEFFPIKSFIYVMTITGCGVWRRKGHCGSSKGLCEKRHKREFALCKAGIYFGTKSLSHAQVLSFSLSLSLSLSLITVTVVY